MALTPIPPIEPVLPDPPNPLDNEATFDAAAYAWSALLGMAVSWCTAMVKKYYIESV